MFYYNPYVYCQLYVRLSCFTFSITDCFCVILVSDELGSSIQISLCVENLESCRTSISFGGEALEENCRGNLNDLSKPCIIVLDSTGLKTDILEVSIPELTLPLTDFVLITDSCLGQFVAVAVVIVFVFSMLSELALDCFNGLKQDDCWANSSRCDIG